MSSAYDRRDSVVEELHDDPFVGGSSGAASSHDHTGAMSVEGYDPVQQQPRTPSLYSPSASETGHRSGPFMGSGPFLGARSNSDMATPPVGIMTPGGQVFNSNSALRHRKAFQSRMLRDGDVVPKPWRESKARKTSDRRAYWIFVVAILCGIAGAAGLIYSGVAEVPKNNYCLVLQDDFNGDAIDTKTWFHEQETGGFGNHEFEWTTDSANNSFVADGSLYIVPTLTADSIGDAAVVNGYTLNLTATGACTATNKTDSSCAAVSNSSTGTIIPPIQSARLITNMSKTIRFGRVEVRARMPTGDWMWPAIWMMPSINKYGPWPQSGEIDIVESKGNPAKKRSDYTTNQFRSSMHWGASTDTDRYYKTTNVRTLYRKLFNQDYHTFGLEWTEKELFTWEKSPVYKVLAHKFDENFWDFGKIPSASANGTALYNPWSSAENQKIAPFDQDFYLILNVAVGGTNGYFEDGQNDNKPWSNNAVNAAADFWAAKDRWLPSWPTDPKKRGMAVDYVKMYQKC